jgi:hypothetical protein
MALARRSVQDFIAQVNARTPGLVSGATYSATLNSDGSVQITVNSVIVYPKVQWSMGAGEALTDSNISGDSITRINNDGTVGRGDAQLFISSLS